MKLAFATRPTNFFIEFVLSIILIILTIMFIEHSSIDVKISEYFYLGNQQWLIEKDNLFFSMLFYDIPKKVLIIFELWIILACLQRFWANKFPLQWFACQHRWFWGLSALSTAELVFLAVVMLVIPTLVATLKDITRVACPNHLYLFHGEYAYLTITQSISAHLPTKCFPAAHASSGFALYALAFIPTLFAYRWQIVTAITVFAWLIGGYKMAIGDHFLVIH